MSTLHSKTQTRESQAAITPMGAIQRLKDGNRRFLDNVAFKRSYADQISTTAAGQYPYAVVLGCIDSRVPVETVLDQGIGDIFTPRVAGNIVNEDLLGSIEFACKLAGSRAVLVLGHTSCGAVKGAIDKVRLGNLTALVHKIEPIVDEVAAKMDSESPEFVDAVAEANVLATIETIRSNSEILSEMEKAGEIVIAGGMYDVSTGEVHFL